MSDPQATRFAAILSRLATAADDDPPVARGSRVRRTSAEHRAARTLDDAVRERGRVRWRDGTVDWAAGLIDAAEHQDQAEE